MKFILALFLSFNGGLVQAESPKTSPLTCADLFPYRNIIRLGPKKSSAVPKYYVGKLPQRYKIAVDLKKSEFSNRLISISETSPVTVIVRRKVQIGYFVEFETVDADGNFIYFGSDIHSPNSRVYYKEYEDTVFYKIDGKRGDIFAEIDFAKIEKRLRTFSEKEIKSTNLDEIVKALSKAQNVGSSRNDIGITRVQKNLENANRVALSFLRSKKDLSIDDISEINRQVVKGLMNAELDVLQSPEEDLFFNLSGGIVRGTIGFVEYKRKLYEIDLTKTQASAENYMNYVPAHLVPHRLASWVGRLNSVSRKTTLKEIAELYKEFAGIHPYRAGVGRTARVLTSYALIKAGFGPFKSGHQMPAEAIHISISDLARDLARALMYPYPESLMPVDGEYEAGQITWRERVLPIP